MAKMIKAMTMKDINELKVGAELVSGAYLGKVTCIDLDDDDKIVIKWECAESEDVISVDSPLWSNIEMLA